MNVVLQSILTSAVQVTGAGRGWIVVPHGDHLEVVAAIGSANVVGASVPVDSGSAAYVIGSGQPVAMVPRDAEPDGVAALIGVRPTSVLCVPCAHDDDVLGALELIDKPGGGAFTFDDVELVTVLANIAGSALRNGQGGRAVRSPDEFSAELRQLAGTDPSGYLAVATVLETLLARG